jgi:hypothetical protein
VELNGVEVVEVSGRRRMRQFLDLPAVMHRDENGWVPPLRADERRLLNPRRNPAHAYCDYEAWLARVDGRPAGRVVGIVNRRYNDLRGQKIARFSHLESLDRSEVTRALLGRVEAWARKQGMERVEGPRGFTDQDPEGLLVEGFEHETALGSYQNREATVRLVEEAGYEKAVDYVVYKIPVPDRRPEFYERIRDRVLSRGKYRLVEFESRRALRPWVLPILDMMDETFRGLDGYSPLDLDEIQTLARRYRPIVDPRFVKVVLAEGEPVGFIIALPSLNEGMRRARGRLFPLGWLYILRSARTSRRQLDLLVGGARKGHRGRGVDVLLGDAMTRSAHRAGFEYMDSHHELESNIRIQREMERMGGRVYKRFRVFDKVL